MQTPNGEMSEWFKELVLKTSDPARDQGFESLSLRQKDALRGVLFFMQIGSKQKVKFSIRRQKK